jgi:hypothetical protein
LWEKLHFYCQLVDCKENLQMSRVNCVKYGSGLFLKKNPILYFKEIINIFFFISQSKNKTLQRFAVINIMIFLILKYLKLNFISIFEKDFDIYFIFIHINYLNYYLTDDIFRLLIFVKFSTSRLVFYHKNNLAVIF